MKRRKKESPSLSEKEKLQEEIASLRSELRRLQLEHDLLQKAGELLKNRPHGSPRPLCIETLASTLM